MKSFTKWLGVFALLVLFKSVNVHGQCTTSPNNGQWPSTTIALNTSCIPTTVTTSAYTAEYSVVGTVTANATYSITSTYTTGGTATGDYITVTESDGTTVVAFGTSPFTWTAPATPSATYRLYRHLPGPPTCGEENTNRTIRVTCTSCAPAGPVACVANSTPANNATNIALTPTLTWATNSNAVSYEVFLGTSVGTAASVGITTTTSLTLTAAANLQLNTTYFWYVVPMGCDNVAASGCSANATSFTTIAGAPVNDECATATALTVNIDGSCAITTAGTITGATASANAPSSTCGTYDDDVWFSFVATNATHFVVITPGSGVTDYTHQLISGACGGQTALVCSDPNSSSYTGFVVGTTYYVRVASWTATTGQTGNFTICVRSPAPPPANDECAGAIPVTVNTGTTCTSFTAGTVAAATASAGAPTSSCGTYDDDVWFSFVATSPIHIITLQNVAGSTTDMTHQVLSGSCGSQTVVVCSDPNSSTVSGLTVGATYYIRVATWTSTAGQTTTFEVCVTVPPNMSYVSSVAVQQTGASGAGAVNQAILRIDVVAINLSNPLSVTDFNLNTNGSSTPADITNAKIYYTGTSNTFATTTLFGTTANPNGAFSISGTQVLTGGAANTTNYFWLTYDLACGAIGPNLDAECTSITVGGTPQTPTTTAPAGNRTVTALSTFNTAAAGNWSNPATWACGVPPASTTIAVGINHNVTLDISIDLQSTLTIGTGATLNLNGNTLGVGIAGTATPQNVAINGLLNVNGGTLNVGTATGITTSNITVNAGGTFTAASGTVNLGPTGGFNRTFSTATATSTCNFTGADININGNILFSNGVINISGGTITVDGNGSSSVASGTDIVRFGATSSNITINGTGGTIIVVDPHASTGSTSNRAVAVSVSSANTATTNLSGITFQFGDGISTTSGNTNGFNYDTYVSTKNVPLGNVTANGGNGATRFISGTGSSGNAADSYTLTVNPGSEVRTIGSTTGVGVGVYGNIVNDGIITISSATSGSLFLGGRQVGSAPAANVAQSISGSGIWRNNVTTSSATASVHNLTMNNAAGTTLQVPLSVGGTLTLTNGKIFTSEANFLAIGTGILPNVGTIGTATVTPTTTTAASHIVGPVHRTVPSAATWTTTDQRSLFPVGDGAAARQLNVAVTTAVTAAGTLVGQYKNSDPGVPDAAYADGGINIQQTSPTGFWNIERDNGNTGGTHTVQANATGFTKRTGGAITDLSNIRLIKRATGGSWVEGADGSPTAPTALSAVTRTGVTSFSEFAIGGTFGALPIELKSFTGKALKSANQLEWVTSTEQNVREHVVERSLDGYSNWATVGTTPSKGDARTEQFYSLEDKAPLAKAFYRLRSVDYDGKEQLSSVISLTRLNNTFGVVAAYPNPATESINIDVNSLEEGMVTANIMDLTGRLIQQQQMSVEKGVNTMTLTLLNLSAGTYLISLQSDHETTVPVRFVKQ